MVVEDHERVPPVLERRLGYLLKRALADLDALVGEALRPLGLTWRLLAVLILLEHEGPMPQNVLGRRARADRTSTVALVDTLEELGFVQRRVSSHDRRAYEISLTQAGRAVIRRGLQYYDQVEREVLAVLEPAERDVLGDLLLAVVLGRKPDR